MLPSRLAALPLLLLFLIATTFLIVQTHVMDIVRLNYNLCHFLFGFAAPLAFGYLALSPKRLDIIPFPVFVRQIAATPITQWPAAMLRSIKRDISSDRPWNPVMGAIWTLVMSMLNEMVVDPLQNGIPFIWAYQHFLADLAGIALFLAVSHVLLGLYKRRYASA
ncbi:conserved membrane hypothetical protein [Pseudomonas sp. 8Z]|uniref:hypothetical protein n=1 Tax=Pseudomonas sp. 8Z TaxID=2653166 RepID=UPI0012F40615|nr:hypothetical protein [Pseudomonas sp. 8Z]VXC23687.1 conserved membrane hypothetical protein [Pseudomonas sp. 8Z]